MNVSAPTDSSLAYNIVCKQVPFPSWKWSVDVLTWRTFRKNICTRKDYVVQSEKTGVCCIYAFACQDVFAFRLKVRLVDAWVTGVDVTEK